MLCWECVLMLFTTETWIPAFRKFSWESICQLLGLVNKMEFFRIFPSALCSRNQILIWQLFYKCDFQNSQWGSNILPQFSSVQLLSRVQLFATPWIAACQASLFITISWSSLRLTSIKSVMSSPGAGKMPSSLSHITPLCYWLILILSLYSP